MKAAQINSYGEPEAVVEVKDARRPVAAKGQVLVEVHAAAINPFDLKVVEGAVQQMAKLDFPATLGGDFAGVVAEVGSGVDNFETGQAVYGQAGALSGQGSFAEFTPVKAASLALKPVKLDFVQAAVLPLVSVSAYQALVEHMGLQAGQKILIHGGAGGIGSMAIQLAKHLGAYVATTASIAEMDFVKRLGADEVIDYKQQDFSELVKDYDAAFDTVGGETNRKSYKVLRPGGILVSMVAQPDQAEVEARQIRYVAQFTRVTTEKLDAITKLIDSDVLIVQIDKIFPLDEAAKALEHFKTGHPRGKVVINIQ